jgi:hypothetical protein
MDLSTNNSKYIDLRVEQEWGLSNRENIALRMSYCRFHVASTNDSISEDKNNLGLT